MSWYQSMAGAAVRLSPRDEKRIGVSGFGVDDIGVLRETETVSTVLSLGSALGALHDKDLDRFVTLEHGSTAQVRAAEKLGRKSLVGLRRTIERQVQENLSGIPGTDSKTFTEYLKWAERAAWELPVGCLDNYPYRCFCLADDSGLSVFECPVARVPGTLGDVLTALVQEFSAEALKASGLEVISYMVFMAFEPEFLSRHDGFAAMRSAPGEEVLAWLEKVSPDTYAELSYWEGSVEEHAATASVLRDIAFAHYDEAQRIRRVCGRDSGPQAQNRIKRLNRIRRAAESCAPGPLRDFAIRACALLRGPSTRELIAELPDDERCERLPGDLSVVDTGLSLDDIGEYYQHVNETALNGDEFAMLPLLGDADSIVGLLVRITTFERLILVMGALIEADAHLSPQKAA
jgi:hypothetical protein